MSEEEIYKMLLTENIEKFPLLNEIFAIRNNKFKINDYTIYVTGCISLDVINRAIEKVNYIDKLQKELEHKQETIDKIMKELEEFYMKYDVISKDKIRELKQKLLEEGYNLTEEQRQKETEFRQGKLKAYEELLGENKNG